MNPLQLLLNIFVVLLSQLLSITYLMHATPIVGYTWEYTPFTGLYFDSFDLDCVLIFPTGSKYIYTVYLLIVGGEDGKNQFFLDLSVLHLLSYI